MSDTPDSNVPNPNPNETPPDQPGDNPPPEAPQTPNPRASKKKKEPTSKKSDPTPDPQPNEQPETTPQPTPAETPTEPTEEPVPVEPAPDTSQPGSVLEELSNRTEEPAESRNELVFDPSSGELVVKPKGESVGSDAVIVSDIADEGFFAEGW